MFNPGNTLEDTIHNVEELIAEEEREYKDCPQIMGYEERFYSRPERIKRYQTILDYLKELQQYRQGGKH